MAAVIPEKIKTTTIPYVHPKVKMGDLGENGKLFTDKQIAAIKNNKFISNYEGRITKAKLNEIFKNEIENGSLEKFNFSLQKTGKIYNAIYKGQESSIGAGAFGSVKVMQNLNTGETSEVIKVLKDATRKAIDIETTGLQKVEIFKGVTERPDKVDQFEIVMDMARGTSLGGLQLKNLSTVVWLDVIIDVLNAVKALHEKGILHNDLKPGNILKKNLHNPLQTIPTNRLHPKYLLKKNHLNKLILITCQPHQTTDLHANQTQA